MTYFKINNTDFSKYVKELKIEKKQVYNAQTNANGDTVVDYINSKRVFNIGIIPLTKEEMKTLLSVLDGFSVSISFLNPNSGVLESNVACIIPDTGVDYFTIQDNRVLFNDFSLKFIEL